jgi:hypothetical protein
VHDCKQGSDAWFSLKASKPSSSNFSKLITGSGKPSTSLPKYALQLATEAYLGKPIDDGFNGNKYTDRGTELEPLSCADYEMIRQVKVQPVGFITDDMMRFGTSTDGLIGDDGVVEFKNLISTTFMEALIYYKKNKKTEPKYIPQLMGELFITERSWVDLVLYNPNFEPIIHRHYPNKEYFAVLKKQLMACIAERNNILKLAKS